MAFTSRLKLESLPISTLAIWILRSTTKVVNTGAATPIIGKRTLGKLKAKRQANTSDRSVGRWEREKTGAGIDESAAFYPQRMSEKNVRDGVMA